MASLTLILPGPAGRAALPGAQAPHLGRRLRSRPGSGAPGQGRAAAPGAWAGSSGGSGPAPRARTSGCRAPTGSRAPRPRNPALLGRSLPRPPGHNQAAHRTPGEMWVRALSSWGTQWLCLKHPPPHLPPSPAGSRCRGHQGRSTLGREPGSRWGLLELTAPLRGREEKAPLGRGRLPPHALPSIREPKSHYHRPVHPRPGDSQGPRRRAALGAGTLGEPKHRGRGPRMGAAGWSLWTQKCPPVLLPLPASLCRGAGRSGWRPGAEAGGRPSQGAPASQGGVATCGQSPSTSGKGGQDMEG